MTHYSFAVCPGDGVGPENMAEALKVLDALRGEAFDFTARDVLVGGAAIERTGTPLPEASLRVARESDAVLFGAVGGDYQHLDPSLRPEQSILGLREELRLFASLKRIQICSATAVLSPLKIERATGVDVLVVRELAGDVYTAKPKGRRLLTEGPWSGQWEAFDPMRYTEGEIRRVAHIAFAAARGRSRRVCSVDKANVLETSRLWRSVVAEVAKDYPDIELSNAYADYAAIDLLCRPAAFDVILTANLFGDILSDIASALTGSTHLPAAALLGTGSQGMFEPGHAVELEAAGRNIANPIAAIRAAALMLRYACGREDLASRVESAVTSVLRNGIRTPDMYAPGMTLVGTTGMGDAVVAALRS